MRHKKKLTAKQVHDLFIEDRTASGLTKESIRGYKSLLRPFLQYFGEDRIVDDLTDEDIHEFERSIVQRYHDKEISKTYVASVFRNTKILLRWYSGTRQNQVAYNWRNIHAVHPTKKAFNTYTQEQIKTIFDAAESPVEWISARNKAIIAIAMDSGLRRAEIANLTREEYLSNGKNLGMLHVLGKGSKERFVPIGETTKGLVDTYMDLCPLVGEYLFVGRFGEQISLNAYTAIMTAIRKKCGFPVTLHLMRHHFATDYLAQSYKNNSRMDAHGLRALLGHTTFSTTDMYVHTVVSKLAASNNLSVVDRIFTLPPKEEPEDDILVLLPDDKGEKGEKK